MATPSTRTGAELARLDQAAEEAGLALVCPYQSAEELHRALIGKYLDLRARRRALTYGLPLTVLIGIFLLV
ncbi:MAG TPA: hypothetical protein VIG34_11075 [Xanthobacteraceae bacterium]|jgi:hypothetical protein